MKAVFTTLARAYRTYPAFPNNYLEPFLDTPLNFNLDATTMAKRYLIYPDNIKRPDAFPLFHLPPHPNYIGNLQSKLSSIPLLNPKPVPQFDIANITPNTVKFLSDYALNKLFSGNQNKSDWIAIEAAINENWLLLKEDDYSKLLLTCTANKFVKFSPMLQERLKRYVNLRFSTTQNPSDFLSSFAALFKCSAFSELPYVEENILRVLKNFKYGEIVDALYIWKLAIPKTYKLKREIYIEDRITFLTEAVKPLFDKLDTLTANELIKLSHVFSIFNTQEFELYQFRLERHLSKHIDQLTVQQIHEIVCAWTKKTCIYIRGGAKQLNSFENRIIKGQLCIRDATDLMFAYSARAAGSAEFHKWAMMRITKEIESMDLVALSNTINYLMMQECTNKQLWQRMLAHIINLNQQVPIILYNSFRMAEYYCIDVLKMDVSKAYIDTMFNSSQFLNTLARSTVESTKKEIVAFKLYMNSVVNIFPGVALPEDNFFIIDFCFPRQKMGLMVYDESMEIPDTDHKISPFHKLSSKLLRARDWEILDIGYHTFCELGEDKTKEVITDWMNKALANQKVRQIIT